MAKTKVVEPEIVDLDPVIDPYDEGVVVEKLYADRDCIGYAQRTWAMDEWRTVYDNFNCIVISHGWHCWEGYRLGFDVEPAFCKPVVMCADLRCDCNAHWRSSEGYGTCQNIGGLVYRGMCLLCDFEGPSRDCENEAVEDAHDHSWPGWRDTPIIRRMPEDPKQLPKWRAYADNLLPAGWLDQGGPIRTQRSGCGTRSHLTHQTGGYDICGEVIPEEPRVLKTPRRRKPTAPPRVESRQAHESLL